MLRFGPCAKEKYNGSNLSCNGCIGNLMQCVKEEPYFFFAFIFLELFISRKIRLRHYLSKVQLDKFVQPFDKLDTFSGSLVAV